MITTDFLVDFLRKRGAVVGTLTALNDLDDMVEAAAQRVGFEPVPAKRRRRAEADRTPCVTSGARADQIAIGGNVPGTHPRHPDEGSV